MQQQTENYFSSDNTVYLNSLPFGRTPADSEEAQTAIKQAFTSEDSANVVEIKVLDRKEQADAFSVFALVKFNSPEAKSKVLNQGTIKIKNQTIQIEPYTAQKQYHIYIKNIHTLSEGQIQKHFSKIGQLNVHIYRSDDHNSCLIRFAKPENAEDCLKSHEQNIDGTRLWLDRYISKEERHEEYHRLFLNKIPVRADNRVQLEALLNTEFTKFGPLIKKVQVQFKESQPKLGYAIIHFQTQEDAEAARLNFNKNLLGGEPLELDNFISKKDREQKGQLYVCNIIAGVDQSMIRELFGKYGKVQAINLNKDNTRGGVSLRGLITFENKKSINEILSEADNDEKLAKIFVDKNIKINVYLNKQEREDYIKATRRLRPNGPMPPMGAPMMHFQPYMQHPMGMAPPFPPGFMNAPPPMMMPRFNVMQ